MTAITNILNILYHKDFCKYMYNETSHKGEFVVAPADKIEGRVYQKKFPLI